MFSESTSHSREHIQQGWISAAAQQIIANESDVLGDGRRRSTVIREECDESASAAALLPEVSMYFTLFEQNPEHCSI